MQRSSDRKNEVLPVTALEYIDLESCGHGEVVLPYMAAIRVLVSGWFA